MHRVLVKPQNCILVDIPLTSEKRVSEGLKVANPVGRTGKLCWMMLDLEVGCVSLMEFVICFFYRFSHRKFCSTESWECHGW